MKENWKEVKGSQKKSQKSKEVKKLLKDAKIVENLEKDIFSYSTNAVLIFLL